MSVSFPTISEKSAQPAPIIRSRFETCMTLASGEAAFPVTRVDPLFEEQSVSFGIGGGMRAAATPTEWLIRAIQRVTTAANEMELNVRPLHVPVPVAIFSDMTAATRALKATEDAGYCPQELMLEFQDASLASGETAVFDALDTYRRKGFRIALDARRSAMTPFSSRIRGAVERLRVSATDLMLDEMLQLRADLVSCIGGDVIVERANWRESGELMRLGATHAMRLLSDA